MKPIKYELLKELNEALEKEGYYYTPDFWQGDSETVYYKTAIVGPKQAKINGLLPRPTMDQLWQMLPAYVNGDNLELSKNNGITEIALFDYYMLNNELIKRESLSIKNEDPNEALIIFVIWLLNNTSRGLTLPKYDK